MAAPVTYAAASDARNSATAASQARKLATAAKHAFEFRALTDASMFDLLREGLAMKRSSELSLSQLTMAANAPMFTKASMVDGRPEVGILPTGQVVGVIDELPTVSELVARTVSEAEATLARLAG